AVRQTRRGGSTTFLRPAARRLREQSPHDSALDTPHRRDLRPAGARRPRRQRTADPRFARRGCTRQRRHDQRPGGRGRRVRRATSSMAPPQPRLTCERHHRRNTRLHRALPGRRTAAERGATLAATTGDAQLVHARTRRGDRMNTYLNVARYHLVDRYQYTALPIATTAGVAILHLVIFVILPDVPENMYTGGQFALYFFLLVLGSISVSRSLPFGLAL